MKDFIIQNWSSLVLIVIAIALITAILLQQRGTSLGGAFGGGSNVYRSKRGIEKLLFYTTVALAILFVGFAILNLFLHTA